MRFVVARVEISAFWKADSIHITAKARTEKAVFNDADPLIGEMLGEHDLDAVALLKLWVDRLGHGADRLVTRGVPIANPGGADGDAQAFRTAVRGDVIRGREGSDDLLGNERAMLLAATCFRIGIQWKKKPDNFWENIWFR